jgi:two-component system NarL family response regulator
VTVGAGETTIRVLIADDQTHFRRGLRTAIDSAGEDIRVVGEAGDGDEAIALARSLQPDVVLLDVRMPGTGGIRAAQAIRAFLPGTRILMLTISDDPEDIALATRAGADGYMFKERSLHDVVDAVRALAIGHAWPMAAG